MIQEVTGLLRSTISANVELGISLKDGTPNILADATQIHQILLNLCTNAWQALEGKPGRIEICLESAVVDAASTGGAAPGRYVRGVGTIVSSVELHPAPATDSHRRAQPHPARSRRAARAVARPGP